MLIGFISLLVTIMLKPQKQNPPFFSGVNPPIFGLFFREVHTGGYEPPEKTRRNFRGMNPLIFAILVIAWDFPGSVRDPFSFSWRKYLSERSVVFSLRLCSPPHHT